MSPCRRVGSLAAIVSLLATTAAAEEPEAPSPDAPPLDPQQVDDDQQDISAAIGLQLTDHWSILASSRVDIDSMQRLVDTFHIKYSDECFVLTATYQETFIEDPARDLEPDRTVMLHFQFKHLGNYQYKTDTLDFVFGDQQNELKNQ